MQTFLESNIGTVEINCPWCAHRYPFYAEVIVPEAQIPEMFAKLKGAYERILYLKNYDSKRIGEITCLEQRLVRDRLEFAQKGQKCTVELQPSGFKTCCTLDDDRHCPL